ELKSGFDEQMKQAGAVLTAAPRQQKFMLLCKKIILLDELLKIFKHGTDFDKDKKNYTLRALNPNRKYLVLLLCLFSIGKIWGQDKVEIAGGEKLFVDQVKHLTYIVGNVILKHQGVVIQCDSAVRNTDKGIIEGF